LDFAFGNVTASALEHSGNRDHLPDHFRIEVVPQMLGSLMVR
jgi:hypothetical protein